MKPGAHAIVIFALAPRCVADSYIRYDPKGDRIVSRHVYIAEVARFMRIGQVFA